MGFFGFCGVLWDGVFFVVVCWIVSGLGEWKVFVIEEEMEDYVFFSGGGGGGGGGGLVWFVCSLFFLGWVINIEVF